LILDWQGRVLDAVDADAPAMVGLLAELVRVPSVSGSEAEHVLQARLATILGDEELEVDHWRIPLAETLAAAPTGQPTGGPRQPHP
jgi:acetylornithine deacetylase